MNTADRQPCAHCDGTGRAPISPALQQTLDALRLYAEATPTGLLADGRLPSLRVSAVSNRLTALLRLGLVTVRIDGRLRWYRAVHRKASP